MEQNALIYVAGHRGLVGSAIVRALQREGYGNLVTASSKEVDLRDRAAVDRFFETHRPEYVFLAAAKVGGIFANDHYPVDFLYDNLAIAANVIHAAHQYGVRKLLFLGSTCIYPKLAPQPLREEYLLTGPLEPTNEWYAVAKIAGIKLCQAYRRQYGSSFISAMPTNLYGPNDNFDLANSHVLPALMRKCHDAKQRGESSLVVWGTGTPRREFLHVDDCAEACLFLMNHYDESLHINIGVGDDIAIKDLAALVKKVVGYPGGIEYDSSKPDGTPRKLVDTTRINDLGWRARIPLEQGLHDTYQWYLANGEK
ncbi:MAG: GDP-L-fucose synthase [Anaerolineae bacterium]|nr:GDP-L-fucose synthase [Anaerolineae bacterium]